MGRSWVAEGHSGGRGWRQLQPNPFAQAAGLAGKARGAPPTGTVLVSSGGPYQTCEGVVAAVWEHRKVR